MVVGVRTIKCYGWENHYLEKIKETRKKQYRWLCCGNFTRALGLALFANMGLVAIFSIIYMKWYNGESLDLAKDMSLLAVIFFTFVSNGQLALMGYVNLSLFLAVLDRLGTVMKMEEQKN